MRHAMGTQHDSTLTDILERFGADPNQPSPISVPNFGRAQLADLFRELGLNRGAEIGVKCGEYAEVLLKVNPNLTLFGIDPYQSYEAYRVISQERQDQCKREALERLAPYRLSFGQSIPARWHLIEKTSVEAAKDFPDNSLDFVYWDGAHDFQNVANDICEWTRVVRPGGICAGHDYLLRKHGRDGGPNTSHHVKQVVDAYTTAFSIEPWFLLGRKVAREGEIRDRERTYLWVKR